MATIPVTSNLIPIPQGEPKEGRMMLPLAQQSGAPLNFVTGNETFSFDSNALGSQSKPSVILSMWVDCTQLQATKSLTISNGKQSVIVPSGAQGYQLLPTTMPGQIKLSTNGGTGIVAVIFYNFNIFAAGTVVNVGQSAPASGAGSATAAPSGGVISGGPITTPDNPLPHSYL